MILFRADANKEIGQGHVMRCLSVADAFRERGTECKFVCAANTDSAIIKERGYEVIALDTSYDEMEKEVERLFEIQELEKADFLILDSYSVTERYLSAVKKRIRTVYLDDVYSFAYPVDVLVNYNVYGPDVDYQSIYEKAGIKLPEVILGAEYAPLREMFCGIPGREQKKEVKEIMISTGGSDPMHLALQLARKVLTSNESTVYHFLIGKMNTDYEEIKSLTKNCDNIVVHYNIPDTKTLIETCDLVVSAAGSTMYEICACGVPMITYAFADNQLPGTAAFEKLGLAVSCGDLRGEEDPTEKILSAVRELSGDYEKRAMQGKTMQKLIDGNGAKRMAERICSLHCEGK
ncbi:MAG: UDP-2,4-diacetamido-2,4,6-trideoxy-beta-L-altropyranose hydrolase [Lachnospiraceae bacterium]|nr:UDP-2,4-diacetamido-2,4,6-trideoxy-beta-L-altropyranose hydrolase [Lachnospiraceae bacterium]